MIKSDNKIKRELLINGDNAFERILQRIKEAKNSIYVNIFIWRDDRIGNEIAKELLAAADRGVCRHWGRFSLS